MLKVFQQIKTKLKAARHYKIDQNGIINRYLAEVENWSAHLNNSKQYIIKSLPHGKLKSIAVLGSGWLLDVPVEELLQKTEKLVFFDINHPAQIKHRYRNYKNIEFVTVDLTNGLIELAANSKNPHQFFAEFETIEPFYELHNFDYVVSLNLLNQLDILLCDYLKLKFQIKDEQLISIRKKIQQFHVNSLPKHKSCLISDYEEINYLGDFMESNGKMLVYIDLDILLQTNSWLWHFDTKANYRTNFCTTFRVIAGKL